MLGSGEFTSSKLSGLIAKPPNSAYGVRSIFPKTNVFSEQKANSIQQRKKRNLTTVNGSRG
jgi:hypothetical protein